MISSSRPERKVNPARPIRINLEKLGIGDIRFWKEKVRQDDSLFAEIYQLIFCDNPQLAWHAAWVLDHLSEEEPEKLEPYISELIDHLPNLKSSSLKRHFTRMLSRYKIPEGRVGMLIDVLYNLLSPAEAIAVRVFSLQTLFQIVLKEPELQNELISVIESILESENSPAINSKGRHILRALNPMVQQRSKQQN
ncbi:MAG: hypothetical protein M1445_10490 [Bacteroidetes bacterium]|nr:hypothetical protein [Bacteroidota bacterium]